MTGNLVVHMPCLSTGLPHEEITLAEPLKEAGYATGIVGKWHLGINQFTSDDGNFLPHTQGFTDVGTILPFTLVWDCDEAQDIVSRPNRHRCFLYQNSTIVQQPLKLDQLSSRILSDAKAFIFDHATEPFFLYYSLPQTHVPMFNHPRFKGSSKRGKYGDQVNEMAWAVGEIMDVVRKLNLDNDTLMMFVSDHGPHREPCGRGGSSALFRGGKGTFQEGGLRVPAIARWPGTIQPGQVSSAVINLMDIFSTFLEVAGAEIPSDREIDSKSIRDLLRGQQETSPHIIQYFYRDRHLFAVRYKEYKIHFKTSAIMEPSVKHDLCKSKEISKLLDKKLSDIVYKVPPPLDPPLIYHVENDPEEEVPLPVSEYQEILKEVRDLIKQHNATLDLNRDEMLLVENCGDITPCCNAPYCICDKPYF